VMLAGGATAVYALSTEQKPDSGSLGQVGVSLKPRAGGLGLSF
jgi:hypothetical protein